MNNIPKANTDIIDSKTNNSNIFQIPKKRKKSNKTPESYNSKQDMKDIIHSQTLQNSTISFEQSNTSFNRLFKNKEEFNNYMLYKKYICSKTQYHKIISQLSEIYNKIKENNEKIEKMKNILDKLKEKKKQKQIDIVNLLSNKESLEEIYKSRIYHLKNKSKIFNDLKNENENGNNKNGQNYKGNLNNNNDTNNNDNDIRQNSTMDIYEQNNFEVQLEEIKLSDKKKYEEQIIIFTEEILQKKDIELENKLKEKINLAYKIFLSESNSASDIDSNTVISNFFVRISLFISNQSLGNYSEQFINSFLRQLIKINYIGVQISEILKFLNKKYKDTKTDLKEKISNLNKRNENLKNKRISFETKKNELKKFIEENKDLIKNNDKSRINFEDENLQYTSFFSDTNLSKNKIFNLKSSEDIATTEKNENIKKERIKIPKIKSFNKNPITNLKDESNKKIFVNKKINKNIINNNENNIDKNNIDKNNKNSKIKNIKHISVNTKNIENQRKENDNKIRPKKLNVNKILNVNNYQINNTWNNNFNGIENKKDLNINTLSNVENINMNNNQILDNFNNYIINCIPLNSSNKGYNNTEKRENNIFIRQKFINNNKNEINVNNLLINNNINIENNLDIENKLPDEISNNKIGKNTYFYSENKNIKTQKKIKIPNNNFALIKKNKTNNNINLGNVENNINDIEQKKVNIYNNNNQIINDKKNDILNTNYKNTSKKSIIMLNDSKSISQKNINNTKSIYIINTPIQTKNTKQKKGIMPKENYKSEIILNNKNEMKFNSSILNNSEIPKSADEKIENNGILINQIIPKKSDMGKYTLRQKFNHNNNDVNYYHNHNTYISKKENSINRKIDISIIDKNNIYTKRYDNRLKVLTQGIKESFCYFKISNNDDSKFDPLDNCSSAPENFGYIDGNISIDIKNHKFKIIPKNSKNNNLFLDDILLQDLTISSSLNEEENDNNKNNIKIELKDIVDVIINKQMKDIIRIYNAYLKFSNGQENININRFIYSREIIDIPMEKEERIKAAFCNFFMFSVIFGKSIPKIEFIFINFDQFNLWFECLQYISKINNKTSPIISSKTFNSKGNFK